MKFKGFTTYFCSPKQELKNRKRKLPSLKYALMSLLNVTCNAIHNFLMNFIGANFKHINNWGQLQFWTLNNWNLNNLNTCSSIILVLYNSENCEFRDSWCVCINNWKQCENMAQKMDTFIIKFSGKSWEYKILFTQWKYNVHLWCFHWSGKTPYASLALEYE